MFLHGSIIHIFFTMLFLWMMGSEIERYSGGREFLKYYLVTGRGAGLVNVLVQPARCRFPTIGASGAIFGIIIAFALAFPDRELLLYFFIRIKAKHFAILVGALDLALLLLPTAGIARFAHLGGLAVGLRLSQVRPAGLPPEEVRLQWPGPGVDGGAERSVKREAAGQRGRDRSHPRQDNREGIDCLERQRRGPSSRAEWEEVPTRHGLGEAEAPRRLHPWDVTPGEARDSRTRLAGGRRSGTGARSDDCGADVGFPDKCTVLAAVAVLTYPGPRSRRDPRDEEPCAFPYIPAFLAFREMPGLLAALEAAKTDVDVLMCDGQGLAHPRGMGLATHVGILARSCRWSGCASRHASPARLPASPAQGRTLICSMPPARSWGRLRTRDGVEPVYVSWATGSISRTRSRRAGLRAEVPHSRAPEERRTG